MRRRDFLSLVGAGVVGLGVGLHGRRAWASWGDTEPGVWSGTTPATRVLEIYLWGGMAPWESFYYRPGVGNGARGFDPDVAALTWNGACPGATGAPVSQLLANDSAGKPVHLGPFARPLWRSDISSRTRVVVLQHDLAPHEAAIPYALSGRRLGRPGACGLGAPLQRRARALDPGNTHPMPFSYCLLPNPAVGSSLFTMVDSVGSHPGNAKPVVIPIGSGTASFLANLNRTVPGAADPLITQYTGQYGQHLFASGVPARTRSAAFADYESSVASLQSAASLATFLGGAPLAVAMGQACSTDTPPTFSPAGHYSGTALAGAAFLLNHPDATRRANHVCVVDGGLGNSGFAYDVHNSGSPPGQAQRTSSHLWETLSALAGIIRAPGDPADPLKISLDDTLVVIRTEFGRTPYRSSGGGVTPSSNGRDHWPQGYVAVLIGGPIQTAGVVGSISDGTGSSGEGVAETGMNYKPQDVQAAALLAAGVNPFEADNFVVGEITPSLQVGTTHADAEVALRQTILGVA